MGSRIDADADAIDVFPESGELDGGIGSDIELVGQRKLVEFGGDGLSLKGREFAIQGGIHVGFRAVTTLGARPEESDGGDAGVAAEERPYPFEVIGGKDG